MATQVISEYQRDSRPRRRLTFDRARYLRIGDIVKDAIVADAAKGQGPAGALKPLAPSTAAEKGSRKPTLRITGKLLDTLVVRPLSQGVVVKATARYARFVLRDRPIMGISPATRSAIDEVLEEDERG